MYIDYDGEHDGLKSYFSGSDPILLLKNWA